MDWLWIIPILLVLVFVHELGHFVTAKLSGITVREFGFGYPPRLFGITYKGTIYSLSKKKDAEHGGFADDDSHVLLVVSNPRLAPRRVRAEVRTKQVAPTILRALGLDPWALDAARAEGTEALPHVTWE